MSLEERTLVVRNFDDRVQRSLLFELFHQAGPVINVVLRTDFAFIEFEHKISVGYAMALFEGIHLFGHRLRLCPKLQSEHSFYKFINDLNSYEQVIKHNPDYFLQFMDKDYLQNHRNVGHNRGNSGHYDDYRNNRSHPYRRQSFPEQNRYSTERNRYSDRHSNYQNYRY